MDWVWKHSRTSGNPRTVLLAVADAVTGPEAEARMGTAEFMRRLNVARSTARAAVDAALDSGELVEVEPAKGSRATLYRIPGAVHYTRATGPESGPKAQKTTGPESGPLPATGPNLGPSTRPESGPYADTPEPLYGAESRPLWGPESGPHHPPIERVSEGGNEGASAPDLTAGGVPPFARPLVDRITAAKVYVGWDLTPNEWLRLDAMLRRSGVDMLAEHAVTLAARQRVSSARYFLRAWTSLPPAPTEGTVPATPTAAPAGNVIPLDRTAPRKGRAAQSADYLAAALAAMEAQQ